ncbi:hypothetical protein ANCCEY_09463 [Ancylostoma ceylanicum]|uniref:Uncharacterized protein n=1 Tax=Ancylostoma ceylanicum TaxID=53326 RepID=A0A0D6LN36_9BILA|nr:hypothetical protein ANCCEY_09463 [Ancylostoma ceylanicum]
MGPPTFTSMISQSSFCMTSSGGALNLSFAIRCRLVEQLSSRRRLSNYTDEYLLLWFRYGQNPRYFEEYLPEIRNILQFSEEMQRNGSEVIDLLMMTHSNLMCIHIRRTDFVAYKVATDMTTAVKAANDIAREKNISQFMIFGDDKKYMREMAKEIVKEGHWRGNASEVVLISEFDEAMDLYVASRMCKAFLITAVTSTFGWFFYASKTSQRPSWIVSFLLGVEKCLRENNIMPEFRMKEVMASIFGMSAQLVGLIP